MILKRKGIKEVSKVTLLDLDINLYFLIDLDIKFADFSLKILQ